LIDNLLKEIWAFYKKDYMDDVDIMKKKRILMACRDIMLNEYAESEVAEEIIADIKKFTNFTANDFFIVKKIIFNYF
jgi:hypothetical protein